MKRFLTALLVLTISLSALSSGKADNRPSVSPNSRHTVPKILSVSAKAISHDQAYIRGRVFGQGGTKIILLTTDYSGNTSQRLIGIVNLELEPTGVLFTSKSPFSAKKTRGWQVIAVPEL